MYDIQEFGLNYKNELYLKLTADKIIILFYIIYIYIHS